MRTWTSYSLARVIFIGGVNGRALDAGDEHLMHIDMMFAGPNAVLGAPEAAVGANPSWRHAAARQTNWTRPYGRVHAVSRTCQRY